MISNRQNRFPISKIIFIECLLRLTLILGWHELCVFVYGYLCFICKCECESAACIRMNVMLHMSVQTLRLISFVFVNESQYICWLIPGPKIHKKNTTEINLRVWTLIYNITFIRIQTANLHSHLQIKPRYLHTNTQSSCHPKISVKHSKHSMEMIF